MSRLAFRSPNVSPETVEHTPPTTRHHIILETTVRPVSANDYDKERVHTQAVALNSLRQSGKDLFEMNETRKVQSAGTTLYQTTETYGTSMSIEKIIDCMQQADLTLRVNFKRPGVHSNTTCMELSTETLQKLIHTAPDVNGHRIAELRVKAELGANVPRHGAMYVAITEKGTQHYLSHIDYKIMSSYDEMYHEQK